MRRSAAARSLALCAAAALAAPAASHAAAQVELEPAAGAAHSRLALSGSGFRASRGLRVRVTGLTNRTVKASSDGAFALRLTVPRRHRRLTVVSASGRRRVVNRFVVTSAAGASRVVEVASAGGARVRVAPATASPGRTLRLTGAGFGRRRAVRLSFATAVASATTTATGRFAATLKLPATLPRPTPSLVVRGGGRRVAVLLARAAGAPHDTTLPGSAAVAGAAAPGGAASGTMTADATAPAPPAPANAAAPTVSGTALVGQPLTATAGTWTGDPIGYGYEWERCDETPRCLPIAGETASTHVVAADDVGSTLRVAVTATNAGGSARATSAMTATVLAPAAQDVGFRDFSYGGNATAPTGQKPQSKLWYTSGGQWWGVLYNGSKWTIHRFDKADQAWTDTRTVVDNRRTASPDVLYSGGTLYVLMALKDSSPVAQTDTSVIVSRFTLSGSTWTAGTPSVVTSAKPETIVFDRDSTGALWVTWTDDNGAGGRQVRVAHSDAAGTAWSAPYVLPAGDAANLSADDIATVVAYGNGTTGRYVGILWSNEATGTLNFARHADGDADTAWERIVLAAGTLLPDDHLNVKNLVDDGSGRVFAVVKTSLNDAPAPLASDPLIRLYTITGTSATAKTVWTVGDDVTRATLLLDTSNEQAHVFGAGPCCSGGVVYSKSTSYDSPAFEPGKGTPFIRLASDPKANNATSTKQTVDATSGLLVEAGDDTTRYYVHNFLTLTG